MSPHAAAEHWPVSHASKIAEDNYDVSKNPNPDWQFYNHCCAHASPMISLISKNKTWTVWGVRRPTSSSVIICFLSCKEKPCSAASAPIQLVDVNHEGGDCQGDGGHSRQPELQYLAFYHQKAALANLHESVGPG